MEKSYDDTVMSRVEQVLERVKLNDGKNYKNEIMGIFGINAADPTYVAGQLRHHGNYTLGVLLTAVEAALGDGKQAEALKAIVRREMFALMDRNQAEHYESLGMQKRGLAPRETIVEGQDEVR